MSVSIYVNVVWAKHEDRPEQLERVHVTARDWDKLENNDFDTTLIRQDQANGTLANLSTERHVYSYVAEVLERFSEEGIEIPDTVCYTVERTQYQDMEPSGFDF